MLGTEVRKRLFEIAVLRAACDPTRKSESCEAITTFAEVHRPRVGSSHLFVGSSRIRLALSRRRCCALVSIRILNGRRVEHLVEIDEVRIVSLPLMFAEWQSQWTETY